MVLICSLLTQILNETCCLCNECCNLYVVFTEGKHVLTYAAYRVPAVNYSGCMLTLSGLVIPLRHLISASFLYLLSMGGKCERISLLDVEQNLNGAVRVKIFYNMICLAL